MCYIIKNDVCVFYNIKCGIIISISIDKDCTSGTNICLLKHKYDLCVCYIYDFVYIFELIFLPYLAEQIVFIVEKVFVSVHQLLYIVYVYTIVLC